MLVKDYTSEQIRNVAFAGHSGSGKTTMIASMLLNTKAVERLEEGVSLVDYDSEEIKRNCSINASLVPVEYKGMKINILDLPGARDFIAEVRNCARVVEAMVIFVNADSGIEVGTEVAWEVAEEYGLPVVFVVNKLDRERANFEESYASIADQLGARTVLASFPVGQGPKFKGIVNLIKGKYSTGAGGKATTADVPAEVKDEFESRLVELTETASEGDDALMEKVLEGAALTKEEILKGLAAEVKGRKVFPVFCAAGSIGADTTGIMDMLVELTPDPLSRPPVKAKDGSDNEIEIECDPNGPTAAFVFKTVSDSFAGYLTYFKVLRGVVLNDSTLKNSTSNTEERISHLMTMRGKKQESVTQLAAGDIGALAKLAKTKMYDTLCDPKALVVLEPTPMPQRVVSMCISAAKREDEEKIAAAIHKMMEQDPTLHYYRNAMTHQSILEAMGDLQVDVVVSRLKSQAKVDAELSVPKVEYRETITKKAEGEGKHKKQSGGRGQFGDCWIRLEPLPEGAGFEFEWAIVGGVIPRNYESSVEKGIRSAMTRGIIAGNVAVDLKATCYDGKTHPVDSSDAAFQIAASKGFKAISKLAGPIILEPINKVRVVVPEAYLGDVMGDLNTRRGRILGTEAEGKKQVVTALVPEAEMFSFNKQLRSISQGRGIYEMEFDHYERVPAEIQAKIVAAYKNEDEEEDE